MIYLDNAATSHPKPDRVIAAVREALEQCGNAGRGAHDFALAATRRIEETRTLAAELLGVRNAERIAFTGNATEALNVAVHSIAGHIVTTEAEHNSVLRPIHRRGNYTIVPVDAHGRYTPDAIRRAFRPDTSAVVVGHGSNLTGNIAPIEEIGRFCRERGVLLILDTAQTAGLVDIDMEAMRVDCLCFTGHKSLLGPQGTGGICLGDRFVAWPLLVGGAGVRSLEPEQPADMPHLLEAGTLNAHGLAGLAAGIGYVLEKSPAALLADANRLTKIFHGELLADGICTFYGDYAAEARLPIVTLNMGTIPSEDVAAELAETYGIAVRSGIHCAPLLHRRFGTAEQGAVRFSFSHANTGAEVGAVVRAVRAIARASRG